MNNPEDPKFHTDQLIDGTVVLKKEADMKFANLQRVPHNPNHFVSLCMRLLRDNPTLGESSGVFVKKVTEIKGRGIFKCAYGYFWATTDRACGKEFYPTREACIESLKQ